MIIDGYKRDRVKKRESEVLGSTLHMDPLL